MCLSVRVIECQCLFHRECFGQFECSQYTLNMRHRFLKEPAVLSFLRINILRITYVQPTVNHLTHSSCHISQSARHIMRISIGHSSKFQTGIFAPAWPGAPYLASHTSINRSPRKKIPLPSLARTKIELRQTHVRF